MGDPVANGAVEAAVHRRRADLQGLRALYSVLDLSDALCDAEKCPAAVGDDILYRDTEHLTASHARSLYEPFRSLLVARRAELDGR